MRKCEKRKMGRHVYTLYRRHGSCDGGRSTYFMRAIWRLAEVGVLFPDMMFTCSEFPMEKKGKLGDVGSIEYVERCIFCRDLGVHAILYLPGGRRAAGCARDRSIMWDPQDAGPDDVPYWEADLNSKGSNVVRFATAIAKAG